ncbi:hypothetical protein SAMN05443377_11258 [Propionibacterium cyclohexanicum]|uniref:Uncharacterized protein n=1 Tax=Propionibacterium cyclohexanicum TaxID=64702 RepID=A0A1H9SC91_9ACTN|nr:hypothetical protein [Propionibacterium cyclohexanicum]SER82538.1 hypothetical protein SAMN05443377_11258 [Propionibacterium cyclohexanicum]
MQEIRWGDVVFGADEDRPRIDVTDTTQGRLIGSLGIVLPADWQLVDTELFHDEAQWRWRHASGGRALVRLSCGGQPTLRVVVSAGPADELRSGPASIRWRAPAPIRAWLGGSHSILVLDERARDARVLAATLTGGFATGSWRDDDATIQTLEIELGRRPFTLSPTQAAVCTWSVRELDNLAALAGLLPTWMPASVTPASGESVDIALPDAVVQTNARAEVDERGTHLVADSGFRQLRIQGPGLDCELGLTWDKGVRAGLGTRAIALLSTLDPRCASAAQVFLVDHTQAEGLLSRDEAESFLRGFFEDFLDRPARRTDPLIGPPLVHWMLGSSQQEIDSPVLAGQIRGVFGAMIPGVTTQLSWLSTMTLLNASGLRCELPMPARAADPLQDALDEVLGGRPFTGEDLWQTTGWLHGPLPWPRPAGERMRTVLACAILSLAADHAPQAADSIEQRLGAPLGQLIEHTRAWLASGPLSDEELAWLVWS